MPAFLIDDGMSIEQKTTARRGCPSITFTYRPALPLRVLQFLRSPKKTPEQEHDAAIKFLVEHLQSWSDAEPVSAETLARVPHPALIEMLNAVQGYSPAEEETDVKN